MVRLTAQQKEFFKENGYIQLKNLIPEKDLAVLIDEYDKLFMRKNLENMENSWVGDVEGERKSNTPFTVKGVHNLQLHHAVFGKILYNENILDALEDILGTENIMFHHTKAHYKPPEKGAAYPLHQDYPYFPYQNDTMTAIFIHLDASTPENGGLMVYPGSHKLGPLEDVGAREGSFHYVDQTKFPFEGATPVNADRGDVVIFSYLLVHGSPLNMSNRPRRMLLFQVHDAADKPVGDQKPQPGYGWMLRGVNLSKEAAVHTRFQYK